MGDKQKVVDRLEGKKQVDKWRESLEDRQKIIEFMHFLDEKGFQICRYPTEADDVMKGYWLPINQSHDKLLNEYFDIDEVRLENERRDILEG